MEWIEDDVVKIGIQKCCEDLKTNCRERALLYSRKVKSMSSHLNLIYLETRGIKLLHHKSFISVINAIFRNKTWLLDLFDPLTVIRVLTFRVSLFDPLTVIRMLTFQVSFYVISSPSKPIHSSYNMSHHVCTLYLYFPWRHLYFVQIRLY